MARFGYYYVVEVLDCEVVDMHACACRVDAIGVEWEEWDCALEGESLEEVYLCGGVD